MSENDPNGTDGSTDRSINRRKFLAGSSALAASGLAGVASGDEGSENGNKDNGGKPDPKEGHGEGHGIPPEVLHGKLPTEVVDGKPVPAHGGGHWWGYGNEFSGLVHEYVAEWFVPKEPTTTHDDHFAYQFNYCQDDPVDIIYQPVLEWDGFLESYSFTPWIVSGDMGLYNRGSGIGCSYGDQLRGTIRFDKPTGIVKVICENLDRGVTTSVQFDTGGDSDHYPNHVGCAYEAYEQPWDDPDYFPDDLGLMFEHCHSFTPGCKHKLKMYLQGDIVEYCVPISSRDYWVDPNNQTAFDVYGDVYCDSCCDDGEGSEDVYLDYP